MVDELVLSQ